MRDAITLNPKLFARVKAVYDNRASLGLAPDQLQVVELTYEGMVRNGALLGDADKAKLKDINGRLSTLQTDFGQKLTRGTKDAALVVNGKAGVAGLGAGEVAAAEKAAADRGNTIYTIPQADAQEFRRKARQVEVEWVDDMNKRGFDGRKLLDTARSLIDKHTKAIAGINRNEGIGVSEAPRGTLVLLDGQPQQGGPSRMRSSAPPVAGLRHSPASS